MPRPPLAAVPQPGDLKRAARESPPGRLQAPVVPGEDTGLLAPPLAATLDLEALLLLLDSGIEVLQRHAAVSLGSLHDWEAGVREGSTGEEDTTGAGAVAGEEGGVEGEEESSSSQGSRLAAAATIPHLLLQLGSGSALLRQSAAWALGSLASRCARYQRIIADAGVIPALAVLLRRALRSTLQSSSSTNEAEQLCACWALGSLAEGNPPNQAAIIAAGVVPALVWLIGSSSSVGGTSSSEAVQQCAAWALGCLAGSVDSRSSSTEENLEVLARAGALPSLLQLATRASRRVQLYAAWALNRLIPAQQSMSQATLADQASQPHHTPQAAVDNDNAAAVQATQAIPGLVSLLDSGSAGVAHHAADALAKLALAHHGNQAAIAEAGAIPHLVRLLQHTNTTSTTTSAGYSFSYGGDNSDCEDSGGIIIRSGSSTEAAQRSAAWALGSLAHGSPPAQKAAVAAAGAIPALVRLLSSGTAASVQQYAAWALGSLATGMPEVQQAAAAAGAIPALLDLLGSCDASEAVQHHSGAVQQGSRTGRHDRDKVQQSAAWALGSLAGGHPGNQDAMAGAGAIPELVKLLGSCDGTASKVLQEEATWALCYLTHGRPDLRKAAVDAGAVQALERQLDSGGSGSGSAGGGSSAQAVRQCAADMLQHMRSMAGSSPPPQPDGHPLA